MSNLEKSNIIENKNEYWQDVENKILDPEELGKEFPAGEFDSMSVVKDRRSFLKIMGFSVSALPLTGCIKIPVKKALPFLNKQDNTIPGVPNWYASTFEGIPVLVKTREGRPIKIEGNDKSSISFGGVNARAQASVLSLYDSYRYTSPLVDGKSVNWDELDRSLLSAMSNATGEVVVVTPSMQSPSEISVINKFLKKYNGKHIAYDAVSQSAFAQANELTHGKFTHAEYDFEKADVVISFEADFLNGFGNNVANTRQYTKRRSAKHAMGMNKHIQVESIMTLTGSNADHRFTKSHADQNDILLGVLANIAGGTHNVKSQNSDVTKVILKELTANRRKSLLISGSNDVSTQVIVNKINNALGNYGKTLWVAKKLSEVIARDENFENLVSRMESGKIGTVFFINTNPVYTFNNTAKLNKALGQVKNIVSMSLSEDETSKISNFVAPMNHVYESWSDTMVSSKELSFTQPVVQPLFGSRMWTESLMSFAGIKGSFYDYMKSSWGNKINWNKAVHDGVVIIENNPTTYSFKPSFNTSKFASTLKSAGMGSGLNIVTYTKYAIGNGDMANNPWLQELPDPITKATWDNYAMINPGYAKSKGIKTGDIVTLSSSTHSVKLPVMVQPGTEVNTVAIALGYGRSVSGKVGKDLGANAFSFVSYDGTLNYSKNFGEIKKTGDHTVMAQTQTHHSMEGRDIVRETTFSEYIKNPKAGNEYKPKMVNIYPPHKKDGHQWAMAINLTSCTGCSSCIISCNAENNIPVVGRQEIANKRDMHWMRLDRYYKGDENQPEVMHMPMLCQHCDNAPCENVCPVMATVQSSDGLNQQIYNRCVGTRYCANNCPYKVRRFNWFNYDHSDQMERMVLNPDVNVRSRGVMEKCSMCIQRIQEGKLTAKKARRELQDDDIKLACQQSCPAEDAIVFGDMNNPESKISKYLADERKYVVLEELNIQPRVNYLTKIRNK